MAAQNCTISREQLDQCKQKAGRCIDEAQNSLFLLSKDIWSCPELAYEEKKSHDRLVRFFTEEKGWHVEGHYTQETAFRASWGPVGGKEGDDVLNMAFLCEYDALPEIGHACGHNLIAEVTVLGTPAEEEGGGKVDMILAGAFEGVDVVFMAHPSQEDAPYLPAVAVVDVTAKYYGKAAHASAYPWEGINALDAAVLAYNNLSALRQQLKPDWRVHGIIKHGGVKPNIIPDYTELVFYLRTPKWQDLSVIKAKAEMCFRSAAMATGCRVELEYSKHEYRSILRNTTLDRLYEENGRALGVQFTTDQEVLSSSSGSTDFGNVSFVAPGIHPYFYIGTAALNHTEEYTVAAGAEEAQFYTLRTAKALAMTALDVLLCPELLQRVRDEFAEARLIEQRGQPQQAGGPSTEPQQRPQQPAGASSA